MDNNVVAVIQKAWEVALPLDKIIRTALKNGFNKLNVPFFFVAVSIAAKQKNCRVFVLEDPNLMAQGRKMICGETEEQPHTTTPKLPILIFLFDNSKVKCLRFKVDKKRRLKWFDDFVGKKWLPVQ